MCKKGAACYCCSRRPHGHLAPAWASRPVSASPVDFGEGLKWSRGRAQPCHAAFLNITPSVGGLHILSAIIAHELMNWYGPGRAGSARRRSQAHTEWPAIIFQVFPCPWLDPISIDSRRLWCDGDRRRSVVDDTAGIACMYGVVSHNQKQPPHMSREKQRKYILTMRTRALCNAYGHLLAYAWGRDTHEDSE